MHAARRSACAPRIRSENLDHQHQHRPARGNNQLDGTSLDDILQGGTEDDFLSGVEGADLLEGGSGRDTLEVGEGDDFIGGLGGNDTLGGGSGHDTLDGGAGDDLLISGSGITRMVGGSGSDQYDFVRHDGADVATVVEAAADAGAAAIAARPPRYRTGTAATAASVSATPRFVHSTCAGGCTMKVFGSRRIASRPIAIAGCSWFAWRTCQVGLAGCPTRKVEGSTPST
jgi:hypothetical protein